MNNLVIIGNGFDLAHGLKTSYTHFIQHLITEAIENKTFNEIVTDLFLPTNYTQMCDIIRDNNFGPNRFRNKFLGCLLVDFTLNNWCDIEATYYKEIVKIKKKTSYYSSFSALNRDFGFIRNALIEYLSKQVGEVESIESYKIFFERVNTPYSLILNFNYTQYVSELYCNRYSANDGFRGDLIYMHGELDSNMNPVVFGYAATQNQARELIDTGENEALRFIKRNMYKRASNESSLKKYLQDTIGIHVSVLGHSCGLSDNLILNQIFNAPQVQSIRIYYYEDPEKDKFGEEHYFQTQVNIDRIMDNDVRFSNLVVDYTQSSRMPQFNDDPMATQVFRSFLSNIDDY